MSQSTTYFNEFKLGSESGLKYFMNKFGDPLRFFAYSIIRNKEAAEEIVSDLFYKLWERREKVNSPENIKAFLYISTRNACYDYIGSPKNSMHTDESVLSEIKSYDEDILQQIILAELVQLVAKEVDKLPAQQAAVFRMSYIEGLSTDEICEKLDTTISNVYFAKSKAMSALKRTFERKNFKLYHIIILIPYYVEPIVPFLKKILIAY